MTQPKIVFCSQFATEKVLNTSKKFPFIENVIQYGGTALVDGIYAFDNILKDKKYTKPEKEFVGPSQDPNRTAEILLSSGTTGLAKGVEITEWNLLVTMSIYNPLVMEYDLSSLEELCCGSAPLSKELEDNIISRIPNLQGIRQGYGLSETTMTVLINYDIKSKSGSVGTVTKGTYCKVVNSETGKNLGPNEIGELYFKGPQIMKGYIGNDAATKETIDSEGWLRTGDLGYYDDDKYFFIVDRIKEMIKFRSCQVPPAELEALLLAHPKIADAGVTGIPNEADGEHPMAFVVKKPNVEVTEQEIKDYIEEIVTDIKKLRGGVKFVNQIPKNATGKILRRELKKLIDSL
ncbi:luciferin 4-monooxygenase-like [Phlebotomus papatasi]|uniref:luciferin 4-monooxygenase-like n=1 Tax=Phlebotomus papatasi TaxID=29031 RepID=UPI0024836987|nr:luciferin 4-monooxygenase-like [Phlebotomus papatasi]